VSCTRSGLSPDSADAPRWQGTTTRNSIAISRRSNEVSVDSAALECKRISVAVHENVGLHALAPLAKLRGPFRQSSSSVVTVDRFRQKTNRRAAFRVGEQPMTGATWISMILVMAFVWGGFSLVLTTAIRKESGKSGDE
jgi:hypothetical protein